MSKSGGAARSVAERKSSSGSRASRSAANALAERSRALMAEREHTEQADAYIAIARNPFVAGSDYGASAARVANVHRDMASMERILSRPLSEHTTKADYALARERLKDVPYQQAEAHADFIRTMAKLPPLHEAFRDWVSGRAYVSNGNYRLHNVNAEGFQTPGSRAAPWNKYAKGLFPANSLDFHQAASVYAANHSGEITPVRKPPSGYQGEKVAGTAARTTGARATRTSGNEVKLPNGTYVTRQEYETSKRRATYGGPVYRALMKHGSVEVRSPTGTRFRIERSTYPVTNYSVFAHGSTTPAQGYNRVMLHPDTLAEWTHQMKVVRTTSPRAKKAS